MPASLDIAFFVFGAILLFLALLGGRFKLFGAEVSAKTTNKPVRITAFLLGIVLIAIPTYTYLNSPSDTYSTSDSQTTNGRETISNHQSTSEPEPTNGSQPETNSSETNSVDSLSGCILTIDNPLVPLMSEPDTFGSEIVNVTEGEYEPTEYTVVENPVQSQGWFKIRVASREGWIKNNTWTIASKSAECP
ncbi:MAG: hypothetical protein GVY20_17580 [Bacteroidetes bacterium]|jgi:hypothetical protein|nr:hypothetical protein [Bacteroidota bacterium]